MTVCAPCATHKYPNATDLQVDTDGKARTRLALTPLRSDSIMTAKWSLGCMTTRRDAAEHSGMSHGDAVKIEQGWFVLSTNVRLADVPNKSDTRPRPCLRRAVNRCGIAACASVAAPLLAVWTTLARATRSCPWTHGKYFCIPGESARLLEEAVKCSITRRKS